MRALLAACGILLTANAGVHADVQVKLRGGRMTVVAQNVPLHAVLDRMASQTGMKIIYDGPPPQQMVKLSLSERTPADALVDVLDGRGINFAVILNPAGT